MKYLITCGLVLVALAVAAHAYNFDDPEYNQVLARDYEEFSEEDTLISHPRARRDEEAAAASEKDKCRKRRPKFCCADDTLESLHEEDKTIKKECYKEVTGKEKPAHGHHHFDPFKCDKEKMDKHRKEMSCVLKCVGQKKDVLDADGNLKENHLKKQIKEKFAKEEWLTPKLDIILDKCIAEAKTKKDGDETKDKDACSCQGMKFGHCFWKELQTSCPADQIKDQKACDKVRERIQNNPDMLFPLPRLSMDDK